MSPLKQAERDAWDAYQANPTDETQAAYQAATVAYRESPEAYAARGGMSWETWMST